MSTDPIKAKSVFLQAVEKHEPADWNTFLDEACVESPELRRDVEVLLAAHAEAGEFLEHGAVVPDATTIEQPVTEMPGDTIGTYKLLQEVGEGGMGVVYMAEQKEPVKRRVALKIIKPGMDTRQVIARFEAERQALAMMDHPNIARVYDGGVTDSGRPYFVMELVPGVPLTEFCDVNRLTTRERLALFQTVCCAIQHAHQKGVIHRDIKPSNVMASIYDNKPVPKVIDFGVAKAISLQLTDKTMFTAFGQLVGTPQYMSPEQAQLSGLDVDTRSDIYSLGVLLYELLAGTTPLDVQSLREAAMAELQKLICNQEAARPSERISSLEGQQTAKIAANRQTDPGKLATLLRGDLDWIVLKALEKDRHRRYETANEFAADIERYLDNEPVTACPPSFGYKFGKFARRNKVMLTSSTLIVAALILGAALSAWQAVRAWQAEKAALASAHQATASEEVARRERDSAFASREELRRILYASQMTDAGHTIQTLGGFRRVGQLLDLWMPRGNEPDLRGWEWHYLNRELQPSLATLSKHEGRVSAVDFHPTELLLASAGAGDSTIRIWDTNSERQTAVIQGPPNSGITSVRWSPNGLRLAAGCRDKTVRIWSAATLKQLLVLEGHTALPTSVTWSPDGQRLASASKDQRLRIWNAKSGESMQVLRHRGPIYDIAWSPNGDRLASSSPMEGATRLWDAATGVQTAVFSGHGMPWTAQWSPDGDRLATAGYSEQMDNRVVVWDVTQPMPQRVAVFEIHGRKTISLAWSPDGKRLATSSSSATVQILDIESQQSAAVLQGHRSDVVSVCWSADGTQLASASNDGTVRLWDVSPGGLTSALHGRDAGHRPSCTRWSPDGSQLAFARGRNIEIVDTRTGETTRTLTASGHILHCTWSPDGLVFGVGYRENTVGILDAVTGLEIAKFTPPLNPSRSTWVRGMAWHPKSNCLAVSYVGQPVFVWETRTSSLEATIDIDAWAEESLHWSPDGRQLAASDNGRKRLRLWDRVSKEVSLQSPSYPEFMRPVRYSPDGRFLALGSQNGGVKILETSSFDKLTNLDGHSAEVLSLSWSPDMRRLASTGDDGTVRLWDVMAGRQVLSLPINASGCTDVAFHPDGHLILAVDKKHKLHILDATPLSEQKLADAPSNTQ